MRSWNAVELARFLKANLNPVLADVEATSDDCKTQHRRKRKSKLIKTFNVRRKTKERQCSYCRPRESSVCINIRTPTTAFFCSSFKELIFDRVLVTRYDPHHCMTCIARPCYASHETYNALFTFLSTICHRAHIDQSGTPLLGWRRVWINKKRLQTVFSRLVFFPTRPYHPVSISLHGQRSQCLNARPSDP